MARVKSSKERTIEAQIRSVGVERTQLIERRKANSAPTPESEAKYFAALAELEKQASALYESLEQAKEDDFND